MPKNKAIDAYIAEAPPFAKPILKHVRKLVHEAVPDVEETIKWRMPFFMHNGNVCFVGAFKKHCIVAFWKRKSMKDAAWLAGDDEKLTMGRWSRITSLDELPSDAKFRALVKEAVALNAVQKKKLPTKKAPRAGREPVQTPQYLRRALADNRDARVTYEALTESKKREYVYWLEQAKREETRERRLAIAIEWLSDGKTFGWRYEKARGPMFGWPTELEKSQSSRKKRA